MLFHAMMEFCLDLLRSKFWLIGDGPLAALVVLLYIDKKWYNGLRWPVFTTDITSAFGVSKK
jgi:hypothetical protein